MRINSETWYLRGTLLFFNGGLRRRTLETKRVINVAFKTPKGSWFFKVEKSEHVRPPWFLADKMMVALTSVLLTNIWHGYRHLRVNFFILLFFVMLTFYMLTIVSCWPFTCWPWGHVDLYHFDHDVMLTFIMLSMVILAFGLTQALLCDIWLVLWIFGEATKVIPHRQNNTSWPKQYLLTLANVRVRTWKQWVTVSEQRTSKSKHLDHHQVLTIR